jgi:hypothetical protein
MEEEVLPFVSFFDVDLLIKPSAFLALQGTKLERNLALSTNVEPK